MDSFLCNEPFSSSDLHIFFLQLVEFAHAYKRGKPCCCTGSHVLTAWSASKLKKQGQLTHYRAVLRMCTCFSDIHGKSMGDRCMREELKENVLCKRCSDSNFRGSMPTAIFLFAVAAC